MQYLIITVSKRCLWTGNPAFYYDVVLTTIAEMDGSRPLWPASPSSGFATGMYRVTGWSHAYLSPTIEPIMVMVRF